METSEYIVYTLLVLVLIAFVGIVGYVIYDNYNYKDNLTTDLNTNFKDINRNFKSTSNVINQSYYTHTSNLNTLSDDLRKSSNVFVKDIGDLNYKYNVVESSNIDTSNISFKNIDTFNYNLNKYFTFKETGLKAYSDANNKLFEYRTDTLGDASRLELMTKTFAKSGLQLDTATGKELGICDDKGEKCFNVLNTADSLYIYKPTGANNIYIGGTTGSGTAAPFKIVDGKVHITGELHINGSKYDPAAFATSGHTHLQQTPPQSDAIATAILGATGKVGSIELTNGGGSGYSTTTAPSVQFIGGGGTGASATAVIGSTGTELGKVIGFNNIISGSGYTSAPSITIAEPPAAVGTATAGVKATANAILVKPIASFSLGNEGGTGYTNAPNVNIIGGSGSGAEAIASVSGGKVTAVTLKPTNNGGSYTTAPTISFTRVP